MSPKPHSSVGGELAIVLLLAAACGQGKSANRGGVDASAGGSAASSDKAGGSGSVDTPTGGSADLPGSAGAAGTAGRGETGGNSASVSSSLGTGTAGTGGRSACPPDGCPAGEALWVRSPVGTVRFMGLAVDGLGNAAVAGYIDGAGTVTMGGESLTGLASGNNPLLIKYDAQGQVAWARTTTGAADGMAMFRAVAIDRSGNTVAAGAMFADKTCTFGDVAVSSTSGVSNFLAVKFDASGRALWARTNSTGGTGAAYSGFNATAIDRDGNIYLAGAIYGLGTFTFGAHTIEGQSSSQSTPIIVKYDADGNPLWVRGGVATPAATASFIEITLDASGNIYALAFTGAGATHTFGDQSVDGGGGVLVRLDPSGTFLWARAASVSTSGDKTVSPQSVTTDSNGDVIVAGYTKVTASYGNDVITVPSNLFSRALLAKYSPAGEIRWARTVDGASSTYINGVAADSAGNLYVTGSAAPGTSQWGKVSVTVPNANLLESMVLAKYDASGTVQWARTIPDAPSTSQSVAAASFPGGHFYLAGIIYGPGTFAFGPEAAVTIPSATRSVLVRY